MPVNKALKRSMDENLSCINKNLLKLKNSQMQRLMDFSSLYKEALLYHQDAIATLLINKSNDVLSRLIHKSQFYIILTQMLLELESTQIFDVDWEKKLVNIVQWYGIHKEKQIVKQIFKAREELPTPLILPLKENQLRSKPIIKSAFKNPKSISFPSQDRSKSAPQMKKIQKNNDDNFEQFEQSPKMSTSEVKEEKSILASQFQEDAPYSQPNIGPNQLTVDSSNQFDARSESTKIKELSENDSKVSVKSSKPLESQRELLLHQNDLNEATIFQTDLFENSQRAAISSLYSARPKTAAASSVKPSEARSIYSRLSINADEDPHSRANSAPTTMRSGSAWSRMTNSRTSSRILPSQIKSWNDKLEKELRYRIAKEEMDYKSTFERLSSTEKIYQKVLHQSLQHPLDLPRPGSSVLHCSTREFLQLSEQYYPLTQTSNLPATPASADNSSSSSMQVEDMIHRLDHISTDIKHSQIKEFQRIRFDDKPVSASERIPSQSASLPTRENSAVSKPISRPFSGAQLLNEPLDVSVDWRGKILPEMPRSSSSADTTRKLHKSAFGQHSYIKKTIGECKSGQTPYRHSTNRPTSAAVSNSLRTNKNSVDNATVEDIANLINVVHLGGRTEEEGNLDDLFYYDLAKLMLEKKSQLIPSDQMEYLTLSSPMNYGNEVQQSRLLSANSPSLYQLARAHPTSRATSANLMPPEIFAPESLADPEYDDEDRLKYDEDMILMTQQVNTQPDESIPGNQQESIGLFGTSLAYADLPEDIDLPEFSVTPIEKRKMRPMTSTDVRSRFPIQRSAPSVPSLHRGPIRPDSVPPARAHMLRRNKLPTDPIWKSLTSSRSQSTKTPGSADDKRFNTSLMVSGQPFDTGSSTVRPQTAVAAVSRQTDSVSDHQKSVEVSVPTTPIPRVVSIPSKTIVISKKSGVATISTCDNDELINQGRPIPSEFLVKDPRIEEESVRVYRDAINAVDVQKYFHGYVPQDYLIRLDKNERERRENERMAAIKVQRNYRKHLIRCREIESRPISSETIEFAKQYKLSLIEKEKERQEKIGDKKKEILRKHMNDEKKLSIIGPHVEVYEGFHKKKTGFSARTLHCAAIVLQKNYRGYKTRKLLDQLRRRALLLSPDLKTFLRGYFKLMKSIQRKAGIKEPVTNFDLNEILDFMQKTRHYELAFDGHSFQDYLTKSDIPKFFGDCDLCPSQVEINNAISLLFDPIDNPGDNLRKEEAIRLLYQIYKPPGTGLHGTRKSTWMHPIIDGVDAEQAIDQSLIAPTPLSDCYKMVLDAKKPTMSLNVQLGANKQLRELIAKEKEEEEINVKKRLANKPKS